MTGLTRAAIGIALALGVAAVLIVAAPAALYPWLKAFHVIAVMAWIAGMLYLPRLLVYHCEAPPGSDKSETFKVMERRLLRGIINPAMVASWGFGLYLAVASGAWRENWFLAKFVLVLGLAAIHGLLARAVAEFAADRNSRSQRFYRVVNEVPTVLMIGIVILVIVRPF